MSNNGYTEAEKVDKLIVRIVANISDPREQLRFFRTIETTCIIGQLEARHKLSDSKEKILINRILEPRSIDEKA